MTIGKMAQLCEYYITLLFVEPVIFVYALDQMHACQAAASGKCFIYDCSE